jgi:maltose O-acetyltransferase
MLNLRQIILLAIYYGLLRNLPEGYDHPMFSIFNRARSGVCCRLFESSGVGVNVHRGARFGTGRNIKVGNYTNLGENVRLNGRGGIKLGDHVLMGPDVIIYTGTHTYDDISVPLQRQAMRYALVTIGDDVWLGARVIILPGVTIGKGCIVGANAVVTRDLPPYTIAVGIPARVIKYRDRALSKDEIP